VNIPVSDDLKTRLAFNYESHDGYLSNGLDDEKSIAGRLTAVYTPIEQLSVTLLASVFHNGGLGNAVINLPAFNPKSPWYDPGDPEDYGKFRRQSNQIISANIKYKFGEHYTLTYIPAYVNFNDANDTAADGTTLHTNPAQTQYTQEPAITPASNLPPYLVIYDVQTTNMGAVTTQVMHRRNTGQIRSSTAFDYKHSIAFVYQLHAPAVLAKDVPGNSPAPLVTGHSPEAYLLAVFSNPVSGREKEYNTWYDKQHVPDVLRNPGFVSGRRYMLHNTEVASYVPPRYLVLFEIQSADIDATAAEVVRRLDTGQTRPSSSLDPNGLQGYYMKTLSHVAHS
jgi:hypothetical protein